jgi:ribosomal protein S18 acetylase RimI-like enzyme
VDLKASAVTLRSATPADVPAVIAFWLSAAENSSRPTDTPDAVEAQLARDPDALMLAVDDGQIVGTVIAGWDGWRAHLYRLAVAPDRRGEGIGRRLIDAAEVRFRALGAGRVDAMVLDDNDRAWPVWRAAGYVRQPDWSRWIKGLAHDQD